MEAIFNDHPPLSRTASAAALELIREAIVEGRLAPGERLKEEQLARQLGISRTPIREALLVLQAEGLVDAEPNRGSVVRSHNVRELVEMYELRAVLEGHAARRASMRLTPDLLAALRESCDRFERFASNSGEWLPELVHENAVFHELILAAADSERLAGMVRQVTAAPLVYRAYNWYSPEQARLSFHAHTQLTNAIGHPDAERADAIMREHVFQARDVLVSHVAREGAA